MNSIDHKKIIGSLYSHWPAAILAGAALFMIMSHGAGVSTDSIVFLNAAENILKHGKIYVDAYGPAVPMTHFPPLYPLVLAMFSWIFSCSVEYSAKIIGALSFAATLHLMGIILRKIGTPFKFAIFAITTLALSEYMILIYAKVFTEPMFIVFMLLSLIHLARFLESDNIPPLLASAMFVSLACLTRYAGIMLIPVGVIAILLCHSRANLKKRLTATLTFSAVSFIPLGAWCARNLLLAATSTNRHIAFHPLGMAHLRQLIRSILFVFLPNSVLNELKTLSPTFMVIAFLLLICSIIAVVIIIIRRKACPSFSELAKYVKTLRPLLKVTCIFLIIYPLFLLCSISLADYTTPLSYRILLPEFVLALPLSIYALAWAHTRTKRMGKRIIMITCLAIFASYATRAYFLCLKIHSEGLGYSSVAWSESELIAYIRNLPPHTMIYTNGGAGILYQTNIKTKAIPRKYTNGKPNPRYSRTLGDMLKAVRSKQALIVYFTNIPSSLLPTILELQDKLDSKPTIQSSDGVVLGRVQQAALEI